MDLTALIHSVFSEAFLVGVDALVTIVIEPAALRWALFEILLQSTHHVLTALRRALFEIFVQSTNHFCCVIMVLIDRD